MQVKFYDQVADELLKFAVIIAKTEGKWVFCKHKDRSTFEFPGGHREEGESIIEAARRELKEETGAITFNLQPLCVYSVIGKAREDLVCEEETFGMLFYADITSFEDALYSEIASILLTDTLVEEWTYPLIQPKLFDKAKEMGYL